jgi:hypothetical protein
MEDPASQTDRRITRRTSGPSTFPAAFLAAPVLVAGLAMLVMGQVRQIHRNGFETREPSWIKGTEDAPFREIVHEMTNLHAHTGQQSEHIQVNAERGTFIYYQYPTSKAPLTEEVNASLWIKGNQSGIQLMARLVLPKEADPGNAENRLTTLLRGDRYQLVGRWQRLDLRNPVKLAREQQQLMRAEFKRDVDFTDAYIDRLVLNVYGGPGINEVWIDDLEIGPVIETTPFKTTSRPLERPGPFAGSPSTASRSAVVELKQDRMLIGGKGFFMRAIRHSDTPLEVLRNAGFNTVWLDHQTSPAILDEAVNKLGFWIVPTLPVPSSETSPASLTSIGTEVSRFAAGDAVLFWDVGGSLVIEQKENVVRVAQALRGADGQHPVGADVWDGMGPYSLAVDVLGAHRWPLMTGLELMKYREWLDQRRLLARPRIYTWTWIQTQLPDWYTNMIYDRPSAAAFTEPIGPQPEQIRLLTYTALASGARGIGFWSDRFLANTHQGRDRLLEVALLNQELQMLEPFLVTAQSVRWIDTSLPEVKAALLRTDHGLLVLPIWLGNGSQFVPDQLAAAKLSIIVPEVPASNQPWRLSPAEVKSLEYERVLGGTKVTLGEFGLTAAILFTSENHPTGILVRLQDQVRSMREQAAHWAHDLAEVELEKASRVESQLESEGHALPDGRALMDDARKRLQASGEHYRNKDYRQAYQEAKRSVRPLRILMRKQWEQAVKGLDGAVASPYAVSFYTLPRHWQFMKQFPARPKGAASPSTVFANALPGGDFEIVPGQPAEAWTVQEAKLDDVEMTARRVTEAPKEGKQCLMLEIKPKNPDNAPAALERTYLGINSPAVHLPPGTPVRISGWVRIPKPITASVDGALMFDSAGGEPLAVRLTNPTGWKQYTLYRQVPASGVVNVTLALTGIGVAYFDDVRVEPMQASGGVQRVAEGYR